MIKSGLVMSRYFIPVIIAKTYLTIPGFKDDKGEIEADNELNRIMYMLTFSNNINPYDMFMSRFFKKREQCYFYNYY
jgi:hypothetical protein